ncbi:MAG: hypothetical protein ACRCYL_19755 [Kluyvera sp.]
MFAPGDEVQPKTGGPKLKVIEAHEDHIVAVQARDEHGKQYTLNNADVVLYQEDGDFGVC